MLNGFMKNAFALDVVLVACPQIWHYGCRSAGEHGLSLQKFLPSSVCTCCMAASLQFVRGLVALKDHVQKVLCQAIYTDRLFMYGHIVTTPLRCIVDGSANFQARFRGL